MDIVRVRVSPNGLCDWSDLDRHRYDLCAVLEALGSILDLESLYRRAAEVMELDCFIRSEAEQIAEIANSDPTSILALNALYDLASSRFGCTSFATGDPGGPVHSHCLDWEIGGDVLRRHVSRFSFLDEGGVVRCVSTGWPGMVGVLVGFAPGRFAVSLNAVWSSEPPVTAPPVALTLRRYLTETRTFHEFVAAVSAVPLACSCLLLVTGTLPDERVVVERTPVGSALRHARSSEPLVVTNHFVATALGMSVPGYVRRGDEPFGEGSFERMALASARAGMMGLQSVTDIHHSTAEEPFANALTVFRCTMRASSNEIIVTDVGSAPSTSSSEAFQHP